MATISNLVELRRELNLADEVEELYWREFWTNKYGKNPDKIEKE
ncbi:MAG: hypothetical protein RL115_925 [Bacteroidota bacterium]|jgi:hypothetical protein